MSPPLTLQSLSIELNEWRKNRVKREFLVAMFAYWKGTIYQALQCFVFLQLSKSFSRYKAEIKRLHALLNNLYSLEVS